MKPQWIALMFAIAFEVAATIALRFSAGFTRFLPSLVVVVGYGVAFYLMSQSLKQMQVGTVYAVWSGVGTALVAILGVFLFKESMPLGKAISLCLIIAGVVGLNVFGGKSPHG
ncbi:MAG: multidrug efflux SMR transporter [Armatimonadetes bacterium]|nr:multidrug efflux SMR transporter [Armatimonadota bacterium]